MRHCRPFGSRLVTGMHRSVHGFGRGTGAKTTSRMETVRIPIVLSRHFDRSSNQTIRIRYAQLDEYCIII